MNLVQQTAALEARQARQLLMKCMDYFTSSTKLCSILLRVQEGGQIFDTLGPHKMTSFIQARSGASLDERPAQQHTQDACWTKIFFYIPQI